MVYPLFGAYPSVIKHGWPGNSPLNTCLLFFSIYIYMYTSRNMNIGMHAMYVCMYDYVWWYTNGSKWVIFLAIFYCRKGMNFDPSPTSQGCAEMLIFHMPPACSCAAPLCGCGTSPALLQRLPPKTKRVWSPGGVGQGRISQRWCSPPDMLDGIG